MPAPVKIEIDPSFVRNVKAWAAACGKPTWEVFRIQGRLLAHELIQRTPPFSGRSVKRIMDARGAVLTADIENMTARQVGARRVERDIRSIFWTPEKASEMGVRQMVEGRQAIRLFATKKGEVYGVDEASYIPNPSKSQLYDAHQRNRTSRGRVTRRGQETRNIGRWRWMDAVISSKSAIDAFIKRKQRNVGRAKGGWAASFMRLGGRMSGNGWIGRHASKTGECVDLPRGIYNGEITLINKSEWADGGDDMRIIPAAIAGRNIRIVKDIERILKEKWGVIK